MARHGNVRYVIPVTRTIWRDVVLRGGLVRSVTPAVGVGSRVFDILANGVALRRGVFKAHGEAR
jgi:hypothetical protein